MKYVRGRKEESTQKNIEHTRVGSAVINTQHAR